MVSRAKWQHPPIPAFLSLHIGPIYMHSLINILLPTCSHKERTSETHRERERGRREGEGKGRGKAQSVYLHITTLYNLLEMPKQNTNKSSHPNSFCLSACLRASQPIRHSPICEPARYNVRFVSLLVQSSLSGFLLYFGILRRNMRLSN